MRLTLRPEAVTRALVATVALLVLANSIVLLLYFNVDAAYVGPLISIFDFDTESTLPTLFSAVAILFSAILAYVQFEASIREGDGRAAHWLGLAVVMLFLSVDEGVGIHEYLSDVLSLYLPADGFLYFLWVVPYAAAAFLIGLLYLPFVLRLPSGTRDLFAVAGAVYLTGALGVEMLGAREASVNGTSSVLYCVLYTIEETLEMVGIIVFIRGLMTYPLRNGEPVYLGATH